MGMRVNQLTGYGDEGEGMTGLGMMSSDGSENHG